MPICVAFQNAADVTDFVALAEEMGLRHREWDFPDKPGRVAEVILPNAKVAPFVVEAGKRGIRIDGLDASTSEQVVFAHNHDIPCLKVIVNDDPNWGDGTVVDESPPKENPNDW